MKKKKNVQLGFTLLELILTMSIMIMVTGILILKYSSFNNTVILKSQAYELALDIREAQTYGVSTRNGANSYREAYGIYVDIRSSGNSSQYILFQDKTGNTDLRYNASPDEQIGNIYVLDPRFVISKICTLSGGAPLDCTAQSASIAFKRPDFDAHISTDVVTNPIPGVDQIEFTISAVNNSSASRNVVVYSSGQISVQ